MLFEPQIVNPDTPFELEMLIEVTPGWDLRWTRMRPGSVDVDILFFNTPRLQFSSFDYNNAILIEGASPSGSIMISVIQSDDLVSFRNQPLEPYELVISKENETTDYLAKNSSRIFTLAVEETFFSCFFFHYFGRTFEETTARQRLVLSAESMPFFIRQMLGWVRFFERERRRFDDREYRRMEREMLVALFSGIRGRKRAAEKAHFDLARVRELLHDNLENIFTIGDLVEELQISARTLQYHFRKRLGVTPKQYLHQLRLEAIRKELLGGRPEETAVSDIALKYGFFHSSHFGSEYKRLFGETPSQTLRTR